MDKRLKSNEMIESLEQESGGKLYFAFEALQSGECLGHRADMLVPTASVIKLPILVHVVFSVHEGKLAWDEPLVLTQAAQSPGTGVLKEMTVGLRLSLRDVCYLMTALSDNTATNMLIEHLGIATINARMQALGLPQTRLLRRAFAPDTPESRPYGLGVTTAREMTDLLTRLVKHTLGPKPVTEAVLAMLALQQDRAAIPRYLPEGWDYAGKTGSNSDLRADVGIVTASDGQQYVLACFCYQLPRPNWTVDNPGLLALGRLAHFLLIPNLKELTA